MSCESIVLWVLAPLFVIGRRGPDGSANGGAPATPPEPPAEKPAPAPGDAPGPCRRCAKVLNDMVSIASALQRERRRTADLTERLNGLADAFVKHVPAIHAG